MDSGANSVMYDVMNNALYRTVFRAVHRTVVADTLRDIFRAAPSTTGEVVVDAILKDPPHPALQNFLGTIQVEHV
jgi:hypothetical protein